MANVSIRDLRNHGGEVIERARRGEHITITREGTPVAELRPLGSAPLPAATLIAHRRHLPRVDPAALRADIDATVESRL